MDLVNSVIDAANVADCGSESPCQRTPCLNGGQCHEIDLTDYECICPENYSGLSFQSRFNYLKELLFLGKLCDRRVGVCELMNPCKNGGYCQNVDSNFKCFCSIGFKGEICSQRQEFTDPETVRFDGSGFLTLSGDYFPHFLSLADEVIRFTIITQEDDGVIFFHGQTPETNGQDKDFFAVALSEGRIEFSFELGSGPAVIRSDLIINDGLKHNVVIKRKGKEGSLEIDGTHQTFGESMGALQMLNTAGDIYVGGLPDYHMMVGNRFNGFVGCISDLEIGNSGSINLVTGAKIARNVFTCDDE